MAKNIYGGGSQTNVNGLKFEQETDLSSSFLNLPYSTVVNDFVSINNVQVGRLLGKNKLYKNLLEPAGVDYKSIISKKLLPDEAFLVQATKTIYIIEKKFQKSPGSVDEKLQTCDFKKKQYTKLFSPLNITIEYIYVLNDWFKQSQYKDVLDYIELSNCHYFFNEIPLSFFSLT